MKRKPNMPENLSHDDILIDCGANVGEITEIFAKTGAKVYAFEPDPYAFEVLQQRMVAWPNVECINKGVLDQNSEMLLYFRKDREESKLVSTQGSTFELGKKNVDETSYTSVKVIDFAEFIMALPNPVSILKMDVEGSEVRILHKLIETGAIYRIGKAYVETHERKIPTYAESLQILKKKIQEKDISNINFNWI
jgi:FkbM family methyltransferase